MFYKNNKSSYKKEIKSFNLLGYRITIFSLLNVIIPLVVGCLCYLALRPEARITVYAYKYLNINLFQYFPYNNFVIEIIKNHLMDLTWSYSLTHVFFIIVENTNISFKKAVIIALIVDIASEVSEIIPSMGLTFDYYDIFVQILGTILAAVIFKERKNE